jgi:hypothetical protein
VRTYELRKQLRKKISEVVTNNYYDQAPDNATYPYGVYDLAELNHYDGLTIMELETNLYDYGTSTSRIEELADNLQDTLNEYFFINHLIQFTCYRGMRQKIEEDDKQLIRRRLTFELRVHILKGE